MQTPPCHHHEGTYIQTKVCRNSSHRCHSCSVNEIKNDEDSEISCYTKIFVFSPGYVFAASVPLCGCLCCFDNDLHALVMKVTGFPHVHDIELYSF